MKFSRFVSCLAFLLFASTCFSQQMYTVTQLGTVAVSGIDPWSFPLDINNSGQVVGYTYSGTPSHAFRTAPNMPINPETDDLGPYPDWISGAVGINDSGQVAGNAYKSDYTAGFAFRTAPNSPINPATDDIGTFSGYWSIATGINSSGQIVGTNSNFLGLYPNPSYHAFRTAANMPINPETDDLGTLGGMTSSATAINDSGQVVGTSDVSGPTAAHAFRTAPNSRINPATDDLGTLYPGYSVGTYATSINDSGQVVGYSMGQLSENLFIVHGFRTAPNRPINPATDDLGSLPPPDWQVGGWSSALDINASGEVVGYSIVGTKYRAFIYSGGTMHDLNDLIPPDPDLRYRYLMFATAINDVGQIVGYRADAGTYDTYSGYLLTPIYRASVQQPINADGSSVFSTKRGVVPVKFAVTQYGTQPSCALPATIAIARIAGGTLGSIDDNTYSMNSDNGSKFRIEGCKYAYNLAASSLGVGAYRVDISINGIMVGHAVFALK